MDDQKGKRCLHSCIAIYIYIYLYIYIYNTFSSGIEIIYAKRKFFDYKFHEKVWKEITQKIYTWKMHFKCLKYRNNIEKFVYKMFI